MASSMNWVDGPAGGTPVTAANLNKLMVAADVATVGTPTGDALRVAYPPAADVIAAEQNFLVGVQSAEQRNLAAGTTVAAWSAADAASTITGAVNVDSVLDPFGSPTINPIFRYLRGNPTVRQPGVYPGQTVTKMAGLTSDATELLPYVLFNHEGATHIEVRIFGRGANETKLRVSVDGAWANYSQLDGPANDGALHRCLITLPDTSKHEIGLEFGGFSAWFAGITLDPAAKVTYVLRNLGPRLIIMGDSEVEGANGQPNTIGNKLGFAPELGRLLGLADTWQSGLGDTGYIGNSGGTRATIGQRLQADAISQSPDWVHLAAGQVDAGLGTPPTYTQMLAAVGSVLDSLRSSLSTTQITVQSPWRPFDSVSGGPTIVVRNAIRDACKARGVPFFDVSQLVTGTGHIGATTGDGNADTYVGADGVHLSDLGHKVAGRYIAAMIRRSLSMPGVPG